MNSSCSDWLTRYAAIAGLDAESLMRERTLLVNDVVCALEFSLSANDEVALLVDGGSIELPADNEFLMTALNRNLENYLAGAPLFIFNADTSRLVIAQRFAIDAMEPEIFAPLVSALAMQARAWQLREG